MSGPYLEVRNTAIEQKQSFFIEYRVIQKDGREIVVAVNSRPEFDDAGEVVALFGTIQDITERKRAEEELAKHREHLEQLVDDRTAELRESEENYRTIFDNAEVGLARMRLSDGKLLEANDRIVEILGYDDRAELFSEFSPERFWADPSKRDEMVAMGFANGVVRDFEIEIIRKDGSHGWVRNYAKFFPEEDYLVNVVVDVTGKKRAEEELTRRTEILEAVMAHVDEGISMVDANLVSVTNNQRFYELLGFPPACFPPGTPYEDYIRYNAESGDYGPGDVEDQVQERVKLAKRFEPHRFERTRPDGTILEIRGNPLPKGGFVTSYTNISERRRAEKTPREREAQLGAIFNHSPIIFSLKDKEGRVLRVNQALCDLMELPEDELVGKSSYDLFPPEIADIVVQSEVQVLHSNTAIESTVSVPVPSADSPRDFLQVKYPVSDETGTTVGIGMVATDITEMKQTEVALRRSNALLAAVHNAQDHFISETNPLEIFEGLLTEMLSLTDSEYGFIGQVLRAPEGRPYLKTMAITNIAWNDQTRSFYEEKAPDGLEFHNLGTLFGAVLEMGQPVIANDPASDPRSGGVPDGHPPLNAFLGVPFHSGGEIVGMAGIANSPGGYDAEILDFLRPLTATTSNLIEGWRNNERRRKAEEAMMAATEAAEFANRSKSEFLANMSHELRTPLNAIIGFAQMMRQQMFGPVGDPHYEDYTESIHQSGEHLLSLIGDILDLSKIEAGRVTLDEGDVDVASTIERCLFLIGERAQESELDVRTDIAGDLPTLRADGRVVRQMLLNLLSNAVKFTERGGEITVGSEITDDGCLRISVTDTGIGMVARDKSKAMATFGQIDGALNRKYQGTGLGLPLVKSLAELHDGGFELNSLIGVGTVATIWFPKERLVSDD